MTRETWLLLDSLGFGGIESHVAELAAGLREAGRRPRVMLLQDHGPHALAARLQAEGVRTVIDLRAPQEDRGYDQAAEVRRLGMDYIAQPIAGKDDITPANAAALHALRKERDGDVLLHCASGNRVGALLALAAVQVDGASPEAALTLGRAAGLKSLEPVVMERLAKPER